MGKSFRTSDYSDNSELRRLLVIMMNQRLSGAGSMMVFVGGVWIVKLNPLMHTFVLSVRQEDA